MVGIGNVDSLLSPFWQVAEFDIQNSRLQSIESVVISFSLVDVFFFAPMISQELRLFVKSFIC